MKRSHQNRRVASRHRTLGLETLERREVLAGNVSAVVRGGNLTITGDNLANEISISRSGAESVTISGVGTKVNGQTEVTLAGFRRNIVANLRGGDDVVRFEKTLVTDEFFRIHGNLVINTGDGNDQVLFSDTAVTRVLHINTGRGNDEVIAAPSVTPWGLRVGATSEILMGTGNDTVSLDHSRIGKMAVFLMQKGNDHLALSNSIMAKRSVLNGGLGYDRLDRLATQFVKKPVIVLFEVRGSSPAPTAGPQAIADTATVTRSGSVTIDVLANDNGEIDPSTVVVTQNPARGTATVNGDGTVTYQNNGAAVASDSFRYTVKDSSGNVSNAALVTIAVTANVPPVAVNDAATLNEGATTSINVSANDTDAGGSLDLTSIVITQNPANGTATANSNGTVSYTHNGSETTTDSFRYTIKDNQGAVSGTATVAITITPVNDPPVAVNDTATATEGGTVSIPVSTNDTDGDGTIAPASIVIVQNPVNGTATANANGTVTYTHNGSETTSDSFRYTIQDNAGAVSGTATVSITVTAANDPPVAVNDTATTAEAGTISIPVSTNDTDADGTIDPTTIVITQAPANGTATANADGTVTYSHNGSETTSDSFQYTIKDNLGAVSGTATVNITVSPVNDPPVAVNDSATLDEGVGGILHISVNDTDVDGTIDLASIVVVQAPAHGTFTVNANGSVSYNHDGSETTSDSFQYAIKDNLGAVSNTATVSITITPVNDAPVAVNDAATVDEGATASINVAGNDTDADGTIDVGTVIVTQAPANGTATANAGGTVTYVHNGSETTSDSFTYTIKDNDGLVSGTATVSVTVTPVNDAPVAADDTATVAEGAAANIPVSTNDTDADGTIDLTSIVVIQSPAHGTAVANANGTVTYTHDGSNTTSDSFTYTIKDNSGAVSSTATVAITLTATNDPPVAVDDVLAVAEGAAAPVNVVANDTDSDGTIDPTSVNIVQSPGHGTAVVNPDGTVTYTHDGSETASDSFTYTVKDNSGSISGTATVTVTVTPVNDAPVAVDDLLTVDEGAGGSVNVSTNDTDADGTIDPTTIVITQAPANGTATANADGTVTYTHNGSETTSDSFTYTIKDNDGLVSGTATVNITVTPVNDPPVAVNDSATLDEGVGGILHISVNDTDVDGTIDLASTVVVQAPAHGTFTVNANGSVSYNHDGSETTSDSFQYAIKDNLGAVSNTATVSITITPVNDAPVAINDAATVDEGATASINVAGNDTDADGTIDLATVVIIQAPANGTAVPNADGTVTYTHDGSATVSDSFTYTIKDNLGAVSAVATVTITITPLV